MSPCQADTVSHLAHSLHPCVDETTTHMGKAFGLLHRVRLKGTPTQPLLRGSLKQTYTSSIHHHPQIRSVPPGPTMVQIFLFRYNMVVTIKGV